VHDRRGLTRLVFHFSVPGLVLVIRGIQAAECAAATGVDPDRPGAPAVAVERSGLPDEPPGAVLELLESPAVHRCLPLCSEWASACCTSLLFKIVRVTGQEKPPAEPGVWCTCNKKARSAAGTPWVATRTTCVQRRTFHEVEVWPRNWDLTIEIQPHTVADGSSSIIRE
jgi:hypothetical protein